MQTSPNGVLFFCHLLPLVSILSSTVLGNLLVINQHLKKSGPYLLVFVRATGFLDQLFSPRRPNTTTRIFYDDDCIHISVRSKFCCDQLISNLILFQFLFSSLNELSYSR